MKTSGGAQVLVHSAAFQTGVLVERDRQRSGLSDAQNRTGTTRCVPHLEPLPCCEPIGFIPQEEQDAIGIAFWRQAPMFLPDTAWAALFAGILRSTRSRVSTTNRLGSNRRGATCTVSRGCAWLFRKVRRAGRVRSEEGSASDFNAVSLLLSQPAPRELCTVALD